MASAKSTHSSGSVNSRSNNSSARSIGANNTLATNDPAAAPPPQSAGLSQQGFGRPPTSSLFSRGNLVSSRLAGDRTNLARPSTAVRAVGYGIGNSASDKTFENILMKKEKQQALATAEVDDDAAKEANPQIKYKNLEAKITKLLEQSIILSAAGRNAVATATNTFATGVTDAVGVDTKANCVESLNKAKEAFSLDRTLHRFRDQNAENQFHNFELTYAVFFNLAEQYEKNDMHIEALNTYSIMTKNKMFPHVNQLKLNMGNIYFKMGIFPKAIKMYRMALDSVPNNYKRLRLKITQNIGILFVRMGQYADAAASFEFIMSERADIKSGIHLILCYYALGDIDKIKSTFRSIVDIQVPEGESEVDHENNLKLQQDENQDQKTGAMGGADNDDGDNMNGKDEIAERNRFILQALKTDEFAVYCRQKKNSEKRCIKMIVDLISPVIEENYNDGYNWCIETIKTSNLSWLANELELNKALVYLRQSDFNQAIETLRLYEKKDESMATSALTNLVFIYLNLGDLDNASLCMKQLNEVGLKKQFSHLQQQNPMALINDSVIDIQRKNYPAARNKLKAALALEPDNFQANYNLGLVARLENDTELAEDQFDKLKSQMLEPHSVQHMHVHYQLAKINESLIAEEYRDIDGGEAIAEANANRRRTEALQSYLQVLGTSAVEIDSRIYEKVGSLYEHFNEHQEANQYYNEAYRINPSDVSIATSIGSYYIKLQATDKAIYYYERAVLANPNEPKLMLRIASCLRHTYMPPKNYLAIFEKIYTRFPDNLACVRALVHVTKSLAMIELHEKYSLEYARLSKLKMETDRQNSIKSATGRSGRSKSRLTSATSVRRNYDDDRNQKQLYQQDDYYSVDGHRGITGYHVDPLGPPAERPRTGMMKKSSSNPDSDDDINAESLLPM